jgi:hypothetical protein
MRLMKPEIELVTPSVKGIAVRHSWHDGNGSSSRCALMDLAWFVLAFMVHPHCATVAHNSVVPTVPSGGQRRHSGRH